MDVRRARAAGAAVTAALVLSTGVAATAHGASAAPSAPTGWNVSPVKTGPTTLKQGVQKRTFRYWSDYGNAATLDVYTPRHYVGKHGAALPTVVLVHGGAWTKGDRTDLSPQGNQLARNGFLTVSVNYRLADEARWPAQRIDVSRAVTFLRKNAAFFNVDKKRMALLGSSAGGQIAAAVATHGNGKQRFQGLIVLSGLLNPGDDHGAEPGLLRLRDRGEAHRLRLPPSVRSATSTPRRRCPSTSVTFRHFCFTPGTSSRSVPSRPGSSSRCPGRSGSRRG